eukprot:EST48415.1 hypothetical protein SS50377_11363 [Spironucleus salmonicida]
MEITQNSQSVSRLQSRAEDGRSLRTQSSQYRQLFSDKLHNDTKTQTFLTFLEQSNNIFNLQQSEGVSGIELYVNAAAQALNSLEQYDSQATLIVSQVIDFLVTDDKLRPKEIIQLKDNVSSLSEEMKVIQNDLEEAVAKKEFFKAESDLYKFRLVSAEDELYKVQLDYESLLKEQNGYVDQINKLQQEKIQIQQDTQHSKQQFNKSAQRQTQLVGDMTMIRSKLENANAELSSRDIKIIQLNETIQKNLKMHLSLENQIQVEVDKRKTQDTKRIEQVQVLQNQILELQLQINDLQLNISKKDSQLNSQNGQIQFQQQQIYTLQQQKSKNSGLARQVNESQFSSSNLSRQMSFLKRDTSVSSLEQQQQQLDNVKGQSRNASVQVIQFYDDHHNFFKIGDFQELEEQPSKLFDIARKQEKQINLTELSEQEEEQVQQIFESQNLEFDQIFSKFTNNPMIIELKQSLQENYVSVNVLNDLKARDQLLAQKYQKYKNMYTQLKMETDLQKLKAKQDQIQKTVMDLDQLIHNSRKMSSDSQGDLLLLINDLKQQNLLLMKKNENKFNIYTHVVNSMKTVAKQFQDELLKANDESQDIDRKQLVSHLLQAANSQLIKTVTSFEDIPDIDRINLENFTKSLLPDLRTSPEIMTTRSSSNKIKTNRLSTSRNMDTVEHIANSKQVVTYTDATIQCELIIQNQPQNILENVSAKQSTKDTTLKSGKKQGLPPQLKDNKSGKNSSTNLTKNQSNSQINTSQVQGVDFGVQINTGIIIQDRINISVGRSGSISQSQSSLHQNQAGDLATSLGDRPVIDSQQMSFINNDSKDPDNILNLENFIGVFSNTEVQTEPVLLIIQLNEQQQHLSQDVANSQQTDQQNSSYSNSNKLNSNTSTSNLNINKPLSKTNTPITKSRNDKNQSNSYSQKPATSQFNIDSCPYEMRNLILAIAKKDPSQLLQASIPPVIITTEVQTDICELLSEMNQKQQQDEQQQTTFIPIDTENTEHIVTQLCVRCQQQLLDELNIQEEDVLQYELRGEKIDEQAVLTNTNSSNNLKNSLMQSFIKQKNEQDKLKQEIERLKLQNNNQPGNLQYEPYKQQIFSEVKSSGIQVSIQGVNIETQYVDPFQLQAKLSKKVSKLLKSSSRLQDSSPNFQSSAVQQQVSLQEEEKSIKGLLIQINKPQFDNLDAKLLLQKQDKLDDITVVKLNATQLFPNQDPIDTQRAKIEQQIKAGIKQRLPSIETEIFINTDHFMDTNVEFEEQIEFESADYDVQDIKPVTPQYVKPLEQKIRTEKSSIELKIEKVQQEALQKQQLIKDYQKDNQITKKPIIDIIKLKKQQQDVIKNKQDIAYQEFELKLQKEAEKVKLERDQEKKFLEQDYEIKLQAIQELDIQRQQNTNKYYDVDSPQFVIKKSQSPNKLLEHEQLIAQNKPQSLDYERSLQYNMKRNIYKTTDQAEPDCSVLISYSKKQLQDLKQQIFDKQQYKNIQFKINLEKAPKPTTYQLENNRFISPYEAALNYRRQLKKLINKQREVQKLVKYDQIASSQKQRVDRYEGTEAVKMMSNQMDMFVQNQTYQQNQKQIKLLQQTSMFKEQIMKNIFTLSKVIKNLQIISSFDSMIMDNNIQNLITANITISQLSFEQVRTIQKLDINDSVTYICKFDSLKEIIDLNLCAQKQMTKVLQFDSDKNVSFVQLPPDIQIKPEQWIIKFIRQMFFELDYHIIYNLNQKNSDFTFSKFLAKYILDKFGIKKLASRFLWLIIVNTSYWIQQQSNYYHEIEIFRLFLANILDIDTLIYYKYCRNLYDLDNINPATLTLMQATKPQVLDKHQIIQKSKQLFINDQKSFSVFSSKSTNSIHFSLLILVAYFSEKRTSSSQQIIKLFKNSTNQDNISINLAHQILSKIFPQVTINLIEILTNGRDINMQMFCQIFETFQSVNHSDSLIREIKNRLNQADQIIIHNKLQSNMLEEMRNSVLILLQQKKFLAAMISSTNYLQYTEKEVMTQKE